jgi:hypothetical protein
MKRTWLLVALSIGGGACKSSNQTPPVKTGSAGTTGAAGTTGSAGTTGAAGTTGGAGTGAAGTGAAAKIEPLVFESPFTVNFPSAVAATAVGDFDGDGKVDVVAAPKATPFGVEVLYGKGDGTFADPVPFEFGQGPVTSIVAGDFDFDGVADMAAVSETGGLVVQKGNKATHTFDLKLVDVTAIAPLAVPTRVVGPPLASGGVVVVFDDRLVGRLEPDGTGNLKAVGNVDFSALGAPPLVAVGDLNGDGYGEVLVVGTGKTDALPLQALPSGAFNPAGSLTLAGPPRSLAVADIDADGLADVIVAEGPAGAPDHVEIIKGGLVNPRSTVLTLPGNAISTNLAFGTIGGQPSRDADVVVATQDGLLFAGESTRGGEPSLRDQTLTANALGGTVQGFAAADTDGDAITDLIMLVGAPGGGSALTVLPGVDTGPASPRCGALDAAGLDTNLVESTKAVGQRFSLTIKTSELFGGACAKGLGGPTGELVWISTAAQQRAVAATSGWMDTFFQAYTQVFFNQWRIDAIFNHSTLECGQGPNGYTVCPSPKNVMPEGLYAVVQMAQAGKIPVADPTNYYQFAAVFDADGDPANNYVPLAAYPKDFFKGTDRWYEALYTPGMGWKLKVSNAHGMTITPVTDSFARIAIVDNVVYFFIPRAELPAQMPGYRVTAFRHKGDYGLKAPYDWDANVTPPVDEPLAKAR